jgi:hypothetical protein
VRRLTWREVCAQRLRRHGLVLPVSGLTEAAAAVCGVHAQVMSAAEVALGLRTEGVTRRHVQGALWTRRELVKTYGPRGTVHLVAARDLPVWCGALSAAPWPAAARPPGIRMTQEQTDLVVSAVDDALGQRDLTVEELDGEIVARTGPWAGERVIPGFDAWWPRWRQAIAVAAYRGVLCFGSDRARRTCYTHPRRWVPDFKGPDPRTGLESLVVEYLRAYGPATADHVAQWLGVPAPPMRAVVAALDDRLVPVEVDGVQGWLADADGEEPDDAADPGVRLLPYFDPYVVGCHPRSSLFPGAAAERALSTTGQAGTRPVLLVDGTVAGIWHQRRSGRQVHLTVEPFTELTPGRRRELDAEVERLGAILEATPTLTIGAVTARSHL